FETMDIRLVAGREFADADTRGAPKVAIVNETMARYFFPDSSPIGRRLGIGRSGPTDIEIIGVVKDVRSLQLRDVPPRFVYLPYRQDDSLTQLTFYVRSAAEPGSVTAAIRQVTNRLAPSLPVFDLKTMTAQLEQSLFVRRRVGALSVGFGALATLLAAVGLYGVMSYAVARRTREIGIRMALGAERGRVLWLVRREVAMLAGIGIFGGLTASLWL